MIKGEKMKKMIVIVLGLLLIGSLYADDSTVRPLVGVELGYGKTDLQRVTTPSDDSSKDTFVGGVKVGAEGEEYRVFISGRMYSIDDFDSAMAFGGEFQYLIRLQETFNIFIGLNGGMIDLELESSEGNRELSTAYFGGDVGVNVDISESIGIEAGVRYMHIDYDHTLQGVTYNIDSIIHAYASLIYKFSTQ